MRPIYVKRKSVNSVWYRPSGRDTKHLALEKSKFGLSLGRDPGSLAPNPVHSRKRVEVDPRDAKIAELEAQIEKMRDRNVLVLEKRVALLRQALIDIARHVGAHVGDSATDELLRQIPREVDMALKSRDVQIKDLRGGLIMAGQHLGSNITSNMGATVLVREVVDSAASMKLKYMNSRLNQGLEP